MAEASFSDAARVDSPNGVQRKRAASTAATTTTIPARRKRSTGTTRSKMETVSEGSTDGADFRLLPKMTIIPDSSTSSRPSDAASFASGAVLRRGRKMVSSIRTPNAAMHASVTTNAGASRAGSRGSPS